MYRACAIPAFFVEHSISFLFPNIGELCIYLADINPGFVGKQGKRSSNLQRTNPAQEKRTWTLNQTYIQGICVNLQHKSRTADEVYNNIQEFNFRGFFKVEVLLEKEENIEVSLWTREMSDKVLLLIQILSTIKHV